MDKFNFKSTEELKIPEKIVDQVLGQEHAVNIIKKAANQRRHVLLIGDPGTGKSMLGLALAELLPKEKLVDVLSFPNPNDENQPSIKEVPAGKGREIVANARFGNIKFFRGNNIFFLILAILAMIMPWWARSYYKSDVMFAALFIGGIVFLAAVVLFINLNRRANKSRSTPKLIVDNYKKEKAPFYDATGAHAGALLGDVLHDPFQCFFPKLKLDYIENNIHKNTDFYKKIDSLFNKYSSQIIHKKDYEAIFLNKNELFVSGEFNGSISPVEVLSCNRQEYNGKMIKLTTLENKELIVTPEHKIAINKNGKIDYKQAKDLKNGDEFFSKSEDPILDEQDIINTYNERQQEQCKLYYQYLNIKHKNPSWGYKRIAKVMKQPIGKTRWWHTGKHIPVPIQTAQWLKEKRLLPFKLENSKIYLITKIIGATFGDGGVFENLNGIFLSSSELESVKEFRKDIEEIFNLNKNENSRIIEGGEYGHSWCYQNTNRNIIRFFIALGTPKGKKTNKDLQIPNWIYLSEKIADEFFGSLFGSEIGIPKVHKQKNRLNTFDIGITGNPEFEENRMNFLNQIKRYLDNKNIETTSLLKRKSIDTTVYRLMISIKFDNIVKFIKHIKINYCRYKKEKLVNSINEFRELKKKKYEELISRGYGAEHAMKILNLTPHSLYLILTEERIEA